MTAMTAFFLQYTWDVIVAAHHGEGRSLEHPPPQVVMNRRIEGPRYQTKRQLRGGQLRSCIVYGDLTFFRIKYSFLDATLKELLHLDGLPLREHLVDSGEIRAVEFEKASVGHG